VTAGREPGVRPWTIAYSGGVLGCRQSYSSKRGTVTNVIPVTASYGTRPWEEGPTGCLVVAEHYSDTGRGRTRVNSDGTKAEKRFVRWLTFPGWRAFYSCQPGKGWRDLLSANLERRQKETLGKVMTANSRRRSSDLGRGRRRGQRSGTMEEGPGRSDDPGKKQMRN
jgi:hypothetical protein